MTSIAPDRQFINQPSARDSSLFSDRIRVTNQLKVSLHLFISLAWFGATLPAQDVAPVLAPAAKPAAEPDPDPKTQLATLFTQLKAAITRDPQSKRGYVEKFLLIAFDEGSETSLGARLEAQDAAAYESLVAGLKGLVTGENELEGLVALRTGSSNSEMEAAEEASAVSPPIVAERPAPAEVSADRFDLENTPHLRQPPKSKWCWAAAALTISQPYKGLDFQGEALAAPIGQAFGAEDGVRGFGYQSTYAFSLLGVSFEQKNLADGFSRQSGIGMAEYAKLRLEDDVSMLLNQGKAMVLGCGYLGSKPNHAVSLLKSKEGNQFLASNPAGGKKWHGIETIANWWPDVTQEGDQVHHFFTLTHVNDPLPPNRPLVRPPGEVSLAVDLATLPKLSSQANLDPDRLSNIDVKWELPMIRWVEHLSVRWSKTKNVSELEGIALAAKINLAAAALGNNPQAIFALRRDATGDGVELVLVDGYRGGFRGIDGEMHVRTQSKPEGEWITVGQFNAFFTSLLNGTNPEKPYIACFGYAPLAMTERMGAKTYSFKSAPPSPAVDESRPFEVESLVGTPNLAITRGHVHRQEMGDDWSGGAQLYWDGGGPGEMLRLRIEGLSPGVKKLRLYPTTGRDYGQVEIRINGQMAKGDYYSPSVSPGKPIEFDSVSVAPGEPLCMEVVITGQDSAAVLPGHSFGLDRIEFGSRLKASGMPPTRKSEEPTSMTSLPPLNGAHPVNVKTSASHCFIDDRTEAMADGVLPSRSSDVDLPRMTWWPNQGTREWVEYTFVEPVDAAGVRVFWFDDLETNGGCRVPVSARLRYRDGGGWKTVESDTDLGLKRDTLNTVHFRPMKITALRIEVDLQKAFSGGILEWEVLDTKGNTIPLSANPVQ